MRIIETPKFRQKIALVQTDVEAPVAPVEPPHNLPDHPLEPSSLPFGKKEETYLGDKFRQFRYGTYCGPGPIRDKTCYRLKDNSKLPPYKDGIDCACMEHDFDYCMAGLGWKEAYTSTVDPKAYNADLKLISKIEKMLDSDQLNWYQRMAGKIISGWFKGRHHILEIKDRVQTYKSPENSATSI